MIKFVSSMRVSMTLTSLFCAALLLAMASTAGAEMIILSSSEFDYTYEGAALPHLSDLDGNSANDFTGSGASTSNSVSGGMLTMVEVASAGNYYISSASNQAWDALGPQTRSDGYTVEARLKVISDNGSVGAISIQARPKNGDANNYMSYLNIAEGGLSWVSDGSVSLGSYDNTDHFHVFRIAQEAGGLCTVWRDGVLVANSLSIASTNMAGRLVFGDVDLGNARRGEVLVDYIRFTTGAYAIPEPSALMILLCGAAVMVLRRRR